MPRNVSPLYLLFTVVLLALCAGCYAAEGGTGAYWPGFRNFLAGVVPSKPGLYFRDDALYYTGRAPRVVLNGLPVANAKATAWLEIVEPEYVMPHKIWGANHAIVVTQSFVWGRLSARIIGTDIFPRGTAFAPGDTVVSPLFLGWQKDHLYYNANLAIFVPTGNYDKARVVNVSRNFWTVDAQFGVTHMDPKTGWEFSGIVGYSLNSENHATQYRSGNVLHLDYAIGRYLKNRVKPGIAGYAWMQVTGDSGPGAIFGSFESRVLGIGPAVEWPLSDRSTLTFKWCHEFGAVDHIEGDQVALSLRAIL